MCLQSCPAIDWHLVQGVPRGLPATLHRIKWYKKWMDGLMFLVAPWLVCVFIPLCHHSMFRCLTLPSCLFCGVALDLVLSPGFVFCITPDTAVCWLLACLLFTTSIHIWICLPALLIKTLNCNCIHLSPLYMTPSYPISWSVVIGLINTKSRNVCSNKRGCTCCTVLWSSI